MHIKSYVICATHDISYTYTINTCALCHINKIFYIFGPYNYTFYMTVNTDAWFTSPR